MRHLLLAVIATASTAAHAALPHHPLVRPEWDVTKVVVEVVYIARDERPYTDMSKPNADGYVRCIIHTWRPLREGQKEMATLGHEFAHCLYGRYHQEF